MGDYDTDRPSLGAYLHSALKVAHELVESLPSAAPLPSNVPGLPLGYARFGGSPVYGDAVHYRYATYRSMMTHADPAGAWLAAIVDGVEVLVAPRVVAEREVVESAPLVVVKLPSDLQLGLRSRRPLTECRDPEHATRLLALAEGGPSVLDLVASTRADVVLRDSCIVGVAPSRDQAAVDHLVVELVTIARAIGARQRHLGPSPQQESRARALAEGTLELGLAVDAAAGRAAGDVAGAHVEVEYDLTAPRTFLTVALHQPLPFSIAVSPAARWIPQLLAHDIATGDGPFDREFEVRGPDPSQIRAWLTPAVRDALRGLRSVSGGVALDARGLNVWAKGILDGPALRELVTRALEAALPAEPAAAGTPYR